MRVVEGRKAAKWWPLLELHRLLLLHIHSKVNAALIWFEVAQRRFIVVTKNAGQPQQVWLLLLRALHHVRLYDLLPGAFHYVLVVNVPLHALIEVGDLAGHRGLLHVVQVYHRDRRVGVAPLIVHSDLADRLRLPL